jgi:hypothetical protein
MTLLAGSGETGMRNRRRSCVEVVLMAADAGRVGDVVIVVDVAIRALPWRNGVRSRQREARCRVIKSCGLPSCRIVASFAGLRESAGHMARIRGVLEIC